VGPCFWSMEPDLFCLSFDRKEIMTPQQIDYLFPFIVFFYGFLIIAVLEVLPAVVRQELRTRSWFEMIQKRKTLAWVCFFIGGIWSLQNVWYY
jgi:hypothetical protein